MTWTIYENGASYKDVAKYSKGSYQTAVLQGYEATSGSTLRGKAKRYALRYRESRMSLGARLHAAGYLVERRKVGRRIVLVISLPVYE